MEDRAMTGMQKYGESKTARIMIATVLPPLVPVRDLEILKPLEFR
jgi:hypothetical protein